jgi:integrase/recombinase XerD
MTEAIGHLQPSQVNQFAIAALVTNWQKKWKRTTVHTNVSRLRKILRALEQLGAPHIETPRVKKGPQRATVATPAELGNLLTSGKPALRLFILLYLQCGLRRSEAMAVTPRTWNPETHTVTIRIKGGRTRTAELTEDVEQLLRAAPQCEPDQSFIEALNGKPIGAQGIARAWERHKQACQVNPQLTAHDLRRTAATILYTATKDLRVPQQLLGHQDLRSTLRYLAPLSPEETRKYADLLRFQRFTSEVKQ